jgi:type II secretory pathway pseudopilin PulG
MQRGFTIIELIIAVGLTVTLLALALPRYTTFSQQQEFSRSAQAFVGCIQQAHQDAVAPSTTVPNGPARYTAAVIGADGSCQTFSYGGQATVATLANGSAASLQQGKIVESGNLDFEAASYSYSNSSFANQSSNCPQGIRVVFGVAERGVPILFSCNDGATVVSAPSLVPGSGYDLSIQLADPDTVDGILPAVRGTVTMSRLGTPVTFELQ